MMEKYNKVAIKFNQVCLGEPMNLIIYKESVQGKIIMYGDISARNWHRIIADKNDGFYQELMNIYLDKVVRSGKNKRGKQYLIQGVIICDQDFLIRLGDVLQEDDFRSGLFRFLPKVDKFELFEIKK